MFWVIRRTAAAAGLITGAGDAVDHRKRGRTAAGCGGGADV